MDWKGKLKRDPLPALLTSKNEALRYFTNRDLVGSDPGPLEELWQLPEVWRISETQQENGSWRYHGGRAHLRSSEDYDQIETYRVLRELVEKYGMNRDHPTLRKAAEFMFSHQTDEGDFRGICGTQHVPYYSGAIMELLIKGGYAEDSRIERGFMWLLSIRQNDGGWAFPLRTIGRKLDVDTFRSDPIKPDKSKPFSHLITGMVLRAFAAHPAHRSSREARLGGELLASRFFEADKYPDRRTAGFWTSFSFPFWFTDLLSSLDSLSLIGVETTNPQVERGIEWFAPKQGKNGLWNLRLRTMSAEKEPSSWITLAVCRVFKRLYG
jgi:squalene-hopene cyclase-like protein